MEYVFKVISLFLGEENRNCSKQKEIDVETTMSDTDGDYENYSSSDEEKKNIFRLVSDKRIDCRECFNYLKSLKEISRSQYYCLMCKIRCTGQYLQMEYCQIAQYLPDVKNIVNQRLKPASRRSKISIYPNLEVMLGNEQNNNRRIQKVRISQLLTCCYNCKGRLLLTCEWHFAFDRTFCSLLCRDQHIVKAYGQETLRDILL
jgi:hypothetical protein